MNINQKEEKYQEYRMAHLKKALDKIFDSVHYIGLDLSTPKRALRTYQLCQSSIQSTIKHQPSKWCVVEYDRRELHFKFTDIRGCFDRRTKAVRHRLDLTTNDGNDINFYVVRKSVAHLMKYFKEDVLHYGRLDEAGKLTVEQQKSARSYIEDMIGIQNQTSVEASDLIHVLHFRFLIDSFYPF